MEGKKNGDLFECSVADICKNILKGDVEQRLFYIHTGACHAALSPFERNEIAQLLSRGRPLFVTEWKYFSQS